MMVSIMDAKENGSFKSTILDTNEPVPIEIISSNQQQFTPFDYVKCNIPGPGANVEDFLIKFQGCSCKGKFCEPSICACMEKYGANYNEDGTLSTHTENTTKPILECNSSCACCENCPNRVVQKGIQFSLCIFQTKLKGWGVKTKVLIPKGRFVCEYAGEVVNYDEARKRTKNLKLNDSNYLLVVLEHISANKVVKHYIDPIFKGNVGRFINHSCQPNLWMTPIRVENVVPKICLFAKRDIYPNEELTFNYGDEFNDLPSPSQFEHKKKMFFVGR